ncbi:hypothetical protein WJT86_06175 [Microvirga sp. W0021]|uniref:Uncharacterized protein n=1 Tax=Hohaiivirga grylli TaxID=3133970 RepID=A0ABV0BKE9_9HYPH
MANEQLPATQSNQDSTTGTYFVYAVIFALLFPLIASILVFGAISLFYIVFKTGNQETAGQYLEATIAYWREWPLALLKVAYSNTSIPAGLIGLCAVRLLKYDFKSARYTALVAIVAWIIAMIWFLFQFASINEESVAIALILGFISAIASLVSLKLTPIIGRRWL